MLLQLVSDIGHAVTSMFTLAAWVTSRRVTPSASLDYYILCSSLLNSTWIGIVLFLIDVVLVAWVKFSPQVRDESTVLGYIGKPGQATTQDAGAGSSCKSLSMATLKY